MEESLNDKEFMLIVNSEVWRVYARDKCQAKARFLTMCRKYSNTTDEESQRYWTKIHNLVLDDDCILIENMDFEGVRKVI